MRFCRNLLCCGTATAMARKRKAHGCLAPSNRHLQLNRQGLNQDYHLIFSPKSICHCEIQSILWWIRHCQILLLRQCISLSNRVASLCDGWLHIPRNLCLLSCTWTSNSLHRNTSMLEILQPAQKSSDIEHIFALVSLSCYCYY